MFLIVQRLSIFSQYSKRGKCRNFWKKV